MTIQSPLDGMSAGLAAKGLVGYCWSPLIDIPGCVSASKLQWLNRFSVSLSANTTSSSQGVSGTASASTTNAQPASLKTAGTTSPSIASTFAKFNLIRGGGALTVPSDLKQSFFGFRALVCMTASRSLAWTDSWSTIAAQRRNQELP